MTKKINLDVAVSTRVRLARNLKEYPFKSTISSEKQKELLSHVKDAFFSSGSFAKKEFSFILTDDLSQAEAYSLMEQHLISPEFAKERKNGGLLLSKDHALSVMVNEEDHLRIQSLQSGLDTDGAYESAKRLELLLDEKLGFAFDERLGYLTHCPTNLGTGLRASVMLHLPALVMNNGTGKMVSAVGKLGFTVRGIYGEGSEAHGDLFQISNQITLGISESETLAKLNDVVQQIIKQELSLRKSIHESQPAAYEDAIYRSYGILRHARKLTSKEALEHLSHLRLGAVSGLIADLEPQKIDELYVKSQAGSIVSAFGALDAEQRDIKRAEFIRKALSTTKAGE